MSKYAIAQPTITVDQRGMLIPLETLDVTGTGIAVIALARGAYLIMRPDLLAAFPLHYLRELSRKVQALEPLEADTHHPGLRKQSVLKELNAQGYIVSDGSEYEFPSIKPGSNLQQLRQDLSTIQGNLAEEIETERDER